MAIIGIDLGTTNSLVAYFKEDEAIVIPNALGKSLTPSIISIGDNGEIFVGDIAKERQVTNPSETVSVFKRSMGSKKEFIIGNKKFLPEELSALVLKSLKEDAERYLGEQVSEVVISVPAYFNDVQRNATKRAGEIAGLKVERLISEPTAAAIAYGLQERKEHTRFLVLDLGGGTFDVSILELYNNIMEVRAVAGDNYLGGEDFTDVIINLFARQCNVELTNLSDKESANLRKHAERAKKEFLNNKIVNFSCKIGEQIYEYELRLSEYERACEILLGKLKEPIQRALKDATIKVKDIDDIVLVGGATKLPIIRTFVGKLFGRIPSYNVNPDEVVALGASIQAAMKARNKFIKEVILTDVCPYTLGTNVSIENSGGYYQSGYFYPIIERNTVIPVSKVERLYTVNDNQRKICVEILQGESRKVKDNIYLGEINVPVPIGKKGEQGVDVRYTYDINGILEVEVTVVDTGIKKKLIIEKNPGYMSKEEIERRMIELQSIKIHPKDKEENRLLLAKGERIYEESIGNKRIIIGKALQNFEEVLEKQDERSIREAREELKDIIEKIEEEEF